jgi:hypothetical protein
VGGKKRPHLGPRTQDERVQAERCQEGRDEHDRLQPGREREHECRHEERLPRARRRRDGRRHRPRDEDEHRVEDHLAHHEPRVGEPRQREGQRRRHKRPAWRHQRPAPEVDRHRGERDHERLHHLQQRVAEHQVACAQRQADDCGDDRAVVGRRPAKDREVPVAVETLPEQSVHHLVRGDPRRRNAAARPCTQRRRDQHEGAQGDPERNTTDAG